MMVHLKHFSVLFIWLSLLASAQAYGNPPFNNNRESICLMLEEANKLVTTGKVRVLKGNNVNYSEPGLFLAKELRNNKRYIQSIVYLNYFNSLKIKKYTGFSKKIISFIANDLYEDGVLIEDNDGRLTLVIDPTFVKITELNSLLSKWYDSTFNKVYSINSDYSPDEIQSTDRIYELRKTLTMEMEEILQLREERYYRTTKKVTLGLTNQQSKLLIEMNAHEELFGGHHYCASIKARMLTRGQHTEKIEALKLQLEEKQVKVIWDENRKIWKSQK